MPVKQAAGNLVGSKLERELVITRVFDAPRELVFKVWTEAEHLARWWGPKDFTNPVCEIDARPGGKILIHMRGPDGTVHAMRGVYTEVIAPEKLVFRNMPVDADGNPLIDGLTTLTFADHHGKTRLTLETRAVGLAPIAALMLEGMSAGWTQSIDRLEDLVLALAKDPASEEPLDTSGCEITATRQFNARRELVFRMWTEPEHITQWWGPRGFTNTIHEMDVRPGGAWRFVMHGPDGRNYDNEIRYVDVVRPERLVYDHVSYPPFRARATFMEFMGQTIVDVKMVFASDELRDKIAKDFGAVEGLQQTLARLGELVEKM